MKRSTRGCGCAIAVLALVALAVGGVVWKFDLINWYRSRPPKPTGELKVLVLDVGPVEGDSILIIAPSGKSVLIDAGDAGKGKVVLEVLKRNKVAQLDYFIATHPHPDHIGGADEVLNGIKVGTVIDNGVDLSTPQPSPTPAKKGAKPAPTPQPRRSRARTITGFFDEYKDALQKSGAQYQKAQAGQKVDLGGGAILTVLAPTEPFFTADQLKAGGNEPNANSIVLRLDYGDFAMLLMGDAEAQTEQRLLSKQDVDLKATVIKLAHHGSKYATSQAFLDRVKPQAAIISTGAWNRYSHPSQSVLDRLKGAGVKIYRTDLQGEIIVTSKGRADSAKLFEIKPAKEATEDMWLGREGFKDDSSRSGFIAYGDFGPPPKPKKTGK
jgi:beta-lactamase superfamily II metal-dependent hydrolase